MKGFEAVMETVPTLFFYTPLIAAMAGNVGVQSSAIIVQGIANDNVRGSIGNRLLKEVGLSLINGFVLALLVILFGYIIGQDTVESMAIAVSMMLVILVAALVGTFVPIILDKQGIDPAIATGPFITTSNDILGIYLFFILSGLIIGF
jgi:magnesium transporter